MTVIKELVNWCSKVSGLVGSGQESTYFHRNVSPFLHGVFCSLKIGACEPEIAVLSRYSQPCPFLLLSFTLFTDFW